MAKATTADTPKGADKPAKPKASKPASAAKPSIFARLGTYFRDVRSEMKRVVWPTRPEVINSSVVVITTLVFFIVFTTVTDFIVRELLLLLTRR